MATYTMLEVCMCIVWKDVITKVTNEAIHQRKQRYDKCDITL